MTAPRAIGRAGVLRRHRRSRVQADLPGAAGDDPQGRLERPDRRRRQVGVDPRAAARAGPRQPRASRRPRSRRVRQAELALALRRRRLRRRRDLRRPAPRARRGQAPAALPRHSARAPSPRWSAASASRDARAQARVAVEKPFGRDLASARALNQTLHQVFPESVDLPHRPLPRQGAGAEPALLPLQPTVSLESVLNRDHVESVQITMAESFGVQGRGKFYEETGAIRDVIQNHMLQVIAILAMDPPVGSDVEAVRDEKARILKAIAPLDPEHVVRGQFRGYRDEPGVARDSTVETFAAVELQHRHLALGGRAVLHSRRQVPAGRRDRSARAAQAAAARHLRRAARRRPSTSASASAPR